MGQLHSKNSVVSKENTSWRNSWQSTRKGIITSLGGTTSQPPTDIPPDNIFVSIQKDDIPPQIPIGRHHPVPKKGVEDDERRTMHTNSFYANAFLGEQNHPIWTHPYSVWWGKGWADPGLVQTRGLCISHIEEVDLILAPGDPAPVSSSLIQLKHASRSDIISL